MYKPLISKDAADIYGMGIPFLIETEWLRDLQCAMTLITCRILITCGFSKINSMIGNKFHDFIHLHGNYIYLIILSMALLLWVVWLKKKKINCRRSMVSQHTHSIELNKVIVCIKRNINLPNACQNNIIIIINAYSK